MFDVEEHGFWNTDRPKQALCIHGGYSVRPVSAVDSRIGLLSNSICTPLGRKLFHTWHLRPLLDIKEISERHDAVAVLSDPEKWQFTDEVRKAMKNVRNVAMFCNRIMRGRGQMKDWKGLLEVRLAGSGAQVCRLCLLL